MAEPSYLEIVRQYHLPTDEQTRAFAEYVAGAHSWYKHLPVYPPVPFHFYLDPNAGRSTIIAEDGEIRFEDIVDESTRFHYTWQLTKTYRARFGYWNYDAPYGTHFLIPRGQDLMDTGQPGSSRGGPAILVPKIGWIAVSEALVQAGTAGVTALVHKRHDVSIYWAVSREGSATKRMYLTDFVERHADVLPPDVRKGMANWMTFRKDPGFQELYKTDLRAAFAKQRDFEQRKVLPLFERERERQIAGMQAAMHRFLDALSESMALRRAG